MPVSIEGLPREFPTKKRTAYKYINIYIYTIIYTVKYDNPASDYYCGFVGAPFLRIPSGICFSSSKNIQQPQRIGKSPQDPQSPQAFALVESAIVF